MLPPMSQESWTVIGVGAVLLGVMVTGQIQTRSAIDSVRADLSAQIQGLETRVSALETRVGALESRVGALETRIAVVEYILQDRLPKVAGTDLLAD